MRTPISMLLSLLVLCLLAACGGNEAADAPNLSEEGRKIVEDAGGPFSESEFKKFLAVLPEIPGLTARSMQEADDATGLDMRAEIKKAITSNGWDEDRFLYVYSHTMTVMNFEQMQRMTQQVQEQFKSMPEDQRKAMEQMLSQQIGGQVEDFRAEVDKQVPASEQSIVMDHMDELMNVMSIR